MNDSPLSFGDRLAEKVRASGSAVCVGLDPRLASLPAGLRAAEEDSSTRIAEAYRRFCCEVIDAVSGLVPVVKPQAAFFEQQGPAGMAALHAIIAHAAARDLLVIVDGKRNDIGSTAEAYADAYLGPGETSVWGSDALTVSPYLGADSLDPFVACADERGAGLFVLVKTSNPGGGFLQDRLSDGRTVYDCVADLVVEINASRRGASGYGPIGAVVGATYPRQLAELRARLQGVWLLIPGFGTQGGGADDVAAGFDADGLGAIVNNSRGLIFAYQRPEYARFGEGRWQEAVEAATRDMNEQLAAVRGGA